MVLSYTLQLEVLNTLERNDPESKRCVARPSAVLVVVSMQPAASSRGQQRAWRQRL